MSIHTKELADKYGVGIHMLAEARKRLPPKFVVGTVQHLNLGVLGPNLLTIHAVWLNDEELELVKNIVISHNPASTCVLGFTGAENVDMGIFS